MWVCPLSPLLLRRKHRYGVAEAEVPKMKEIRVPHSVKQLVCRASMIDNYSSIMCLQDAKMVKRMSLGIMSPPTIPIIHKLATAVIIINPCSPFPDALT